MNCGGIHHFDLAWCDSCDPAIVTRRAMARRLELRRQCIVVTIHICQYTWKMLQRRSIKQLHKQNKSAICSLHHPRVHKHVGAGSSFKLDERIKNLILLNDPLKWTLVVVLLCWHLRSISIMKDCPLTLCTEQGQDSNFSFPHQVYISIKMSQSIVDSKLKNYELLLLFPRCCCQQWEGFVSGLRNVAKYFVSTPSDSRITPDRGQGTLRCA